MGFFKSIGKAIKKVVKGIGKVFKAIGKGVQKILSSKVFKVVATVAAVFTAGVAIYAGVQGAIGGAATVQGLGAKLVAGGEGFISGVGKGLAASKDAMGSLVKGDVAGAGEALSGLSNNGNIVTAGLDVASEAQGAITEAAATESGISQGLTESIANTSKVPSLDVVKAADSVPNLAPGQGYLSKAASMASKGGSGVAKFIESNPTTSLMLGNAISGYANSRDAEKAEQQAYDREQQRREEWANINFDPRLPSVEQGFLNRAKAAYSQ